MPNKTNKAAVLLSYLHVYLNEQLANGGPLITRPATNPLKMNMLRSRIEAHHPWNALVHHTLQPVSGNFPAYYNSLHTKQDMTKSAPFAGNVKATYDAYHLFMGVPSVPPQRVAKSVPISAPVTTAPVTESKPPSIGYHLLLNRVKKAYTSPTGAVTVEALYTRDGVTDPPAHVYDQVYEDVLGVKPPKGSVQQVASSLASALDTRKSARLQRAAQSTTIQQTMMERLVPYVPQRPPLKRIDTIGAHNTGARRRHRRKKSYSSSSSDDDDISSCHDEIKATIEDDFGDMPFVSTGASMGLPELEPIERRARRRSKSKRRSKSRSRHSSDSESIGDEFSAMGLPTVAEAIAAAAKLARQAK